MSGNRQIKVTILGDASSGRAAFASLGDGADSASVKIDGLGSHLSKLGQVAQSAITGISFAAWNLAFQKLEGFLSTAREGIIGTNAMLEQGAVSWGVLLGGADAATAKIQELYHFAAVTPFAFGEVQQASLLLQTFGGNALNTTKTLTLVGDVASGTNQSFQEVAFWAGRMYSAMQSGQPFGEAAMRMQEMGAISGDTLLQLQKMQAAGASGTEMWNVFTGSLGRFNGMMIQQSNTFNGRLSTMQDTLNQFLGVAGKPIFDRASASLQKMIDLLSSDRAQRIAVDIAAGLTKAYDVLDRILAGVVHEAARALPYLGLIRDTFITMGQAAQGNWFGGQTSSINIITRSLGRFVQLSRDAILTFGQAFRGDWAGQATTSINGVVRLFGILGDHLGRVARNIRDLFTGRENLGDFIGRWFSDRGDLFRNVGRLITDSVFPALLAGLRALPGWFQQHNPLPELGQFLSDRFADLVHFIRFDAGPWFGNLFSALGTWLHDHGGDVWSGLGDLAGTAGGFIVKLSDALVNWVNDHPDQIIAKAGQIGTSIAGLITMSLSKLPLLGEGTLDIFGGIKGAGQELGKRGGRGQALDTLVAAGVRLASAILAGIGQGLLKVTDVIGNVFKALFAPGGQTAAGGQTVTDAGTQIGTTLGQGVGAAFKDRILPELGRLKDVLLGLFEIVGKIFENLGTNLGIYIEKGFVQGMIGGVQHMLDNMPDWLKALLGVDSAGAAAGFAAAQTFVNGIQPVPILTPDDRKRLDALFAGPTPAYMQPTQGGTQGDNNGQNGGPQTVIVNQYINGPTLPEVVQAIGDGVVSAIGGGGGGGLLTP